MILLVSNFSRKDSGWSLVPEIAESDTKRIACCWTGCYDGEYYVIEEQLLFRQLSTNWRMTLIQSMESNRHYTVFAKNW